MQEKLDGRNKEGRIPENFLKHSPKTWIVKPLNFPTILGSPGNRKLCAVSEGIHEAK